MKKSKEDVVVKGKEPQGLVYPIVQRSVFVCYEESTGLVYATHLREALRKMKIVAFVAVKDIKKGEPPQEIIDETIKGCNYFLVIITYPALNSEEVEREIRLALYFNKAIIPCKYEGVQRGAVSELPRISKLQQIDFENKEDLANKVISEIFERDGSVTKYSSTIPIRNVAIA